MSDTPEKIDLSVIGQYLAAKLEASEKENERLEELYSNSQKEVSEVQRVYCDLQSAFNEKVKSLQEEIGRLKEKLEIAKKNLLWVNEVADHLWRDEYSTSCIKDQYLGIMMHCDDALSKLTPSGELK